MRKYINVLCLIPVIVIMAIILDADQGLKVSYTDSFLGLLNVGIMGFLTYLIYQTNKRLTQLSEKQIRNELEFRINPILYILEENIESLYHYSRFLKLNFSGYKKQAMLMNDLKGIVLKFEENQIFNKGTLDRISNINPMTEEGINEINSYFNKIVVLEVFDYEDLRNIDNYINILNKINSNLEYKKIMLKFSRDINYTVALSSNLNSLISEIESFDFSLEMRIGSLSSSIHGAIMDIIKDLEETRESLLIQYKNI